MIDLHCHLLPGLDDGPGTISESVALARQAIADGVRVVAATPHVRDDYPTGAPQMESSLAAVREALAAENLALTVVPGGEIAIDWIRRLSPDELSRFSLGGGSGYVLVEFPHTGWPLTLSRGIVTLKRQGLRAILAHPERNYEVQLDPTKLEGFVRAGALIQLTATSFIGSDGRAVRRVATAMLDSGLAHAVASDAHGSGVRDYSLSRAVVEIADETLGEWCTTLVPEAVLAGRDIPHRPSAPVQRRSLWPRRKS